MCNKMRLRAMPRPGCDTIARGSHVPVRRCSDLAKGTAMEFGSRSSVGPIALTRRGMLAGSAAMLAQLPGLRRAEAAPNGSMTLAWHTAMTPRWLDPQEHDGT